MRQPAARSRPSSRACRAGRAPGAAPPRKARRRCRRAARRPRAPLRRTSPRAADRPCRQSAARAATTAGRCRRRGWARSTPRERAGTRSNEGPSAALPPHEGYTGQGRRLISSARARSSVYQGAVRRRNGVNEHPIPGSEAGQSERRRLAIVFVIMPLVAAPIFWTSSRLSADSKLLAHSNEVLESLYSARAALRQSVIALHAFLRTSDEGI